MVSPFTISLVNIFTTFAFLITLAKVLLYSSWSASLLEVFLYSESVLNPVARAIAASILIISTISLSPASAGTNIPKTAKIIFNNNAPHNTLIHISLKAVRNIDQSDSLFFLAN